MIPDDALLQFGPYGSFRMNTNREYYEWIVPMCTDPARQVLYLVDWSAFNGCGKDLHMFFDEQGQSGIPFIGQCHFPYVREVVE